MDASLISSQTVDLVSRLTGEKLRQEDISSPVLFLAALMILLQGVIYADGTVSAEETQRLETTLRELIPANNSWQQLARLMVQGLEEQQAYREIQDLLELTSSFSEEEKLLLISFGYQMSAADGTMDDREKEYLQTIASRLGINEGFLSVLEASFSNQPIANIETLAEVHSLLDPARFQFLDSLFVRAASHIIEHLPAKPKQQRNQQHSVSSYQELQKFQESRQKLNKVCGKVYAILQDESDRAILSPNLIAEISKISQKLESQRFRVAVVGEFSKGKSTLLNALLGEEIQPVRDIPCSGTVTVLKYGWQQRVTCKYKNGSEEEISPQEYKDKAAISEEAALNSVEDEIANSEIQEIIFEHPHLELCRYGVEIIDSPGLNEQAERTLITEQVLKTADAVVFLTHAQNALTEKERELLWYLKKELHPSNEGAKNLFILVNFYDLIRREESRKQIRKRVENIVNNLIVGHNRIHFISAQSALDAILDGIENDHLRSFQDFTKSLEQFLTKELGEIALQNSATRIKQILNNSCDELSQYAKTLEGKLTVSQEDKLKIFEQLAEVSGRDIKIKLLTDKLKEKSVKEVKQSWEEWLKGLSDRITLKSAKWTSKHSQIWSQDKLIRDYANQFVGEITEDIDGWANQKVLKIVQENMAELDPEIAANITAIREEFRLFDRQLHASLETQFNNLPITEKIDVIDRHGLGIASSIDPDVGGAGGFIGGLGLGGLVTAGLLVFTGLGIIPVILGGLVAAAGGSFGLGLLDIDDIHKQIKQKVVELGLQQFYQSLDNIFDKISERTNLAFNYKYETISNTTAQAMLLWENLLEQQERYEQKNQQECEVEKAWVADKIRELKQMEKQIESILNPSV